jgi:glycosyltransferase involved in cell wall biosynthesis
MNNKILLSIAIPTWNRSHSLKNLLNNILCQAKELEGGIEVCISDNGSTDDTREVVMGLKKEYPLLINYNKNKKNFGYDKNMLLAIEMSKGDFIWTLGDDDSVVENGLKEIIGFIKKNNNENTGLIILRTESYFVDKQTGTKMVCGNTLDKNKPAVFKTEKEDIIGMRSPVAGFMSVLVFNSKILKQTIKEETKIVERAIGTSFMCVFLRSLMFLKYPRLDAVALNKPMILQELPRYKFFIEDKFFLHYQVQKRICGLLLSYKHTDNSCAPLIIKISRRLKRRFIEDMIVMRAFKNFNYFSFFGCLKLFFQEAVFIDALVFSFVFLILFLIPPAILILAYKFLLMIKHGKKWRTRWFLASNFISITSGGTRRSSYMSCD